MKDLKFCIFGGTTEGRIIAEILSQSDIKSDLYLATEYGVQFVKNIPNVSVYNSRLDCDEMELLFKEKKYDYVIDATHPFAKAVSSNIVKSANKCKLKIIRIIRKSNPNEFGRYFDSVEECVEYLNTRDGNILLTTGSKDLDKFARIDNYQSRIYIRILPMEESLNRAITLGYKNKNIICMQGPISEEMNTATINSVRAKYVVTKESSNSGGFEEKVSACQNIGIECLIIKKPEETGLTIEELKKIITTM